MNETRATGDGADGEDPGHFGRVKDFMGGGYSKASDAVRDGYNNVREKVEDVDFGAITDQVYAVLFVQNSVKSRTSFGGTAPAQVRRQVRHWRKRLGKA